MEALPPPPPGTTIEQAADLKCLGLGLFLAEGSHGRDPHLVRVYLKRLRKVDPSRDWKASAPKVSGDMLYGEFMGLMNECSNRLTRDERPRGPLPN